MLGGLLRQRRRLHGDERVRVVRQANAGVAAALLVATAVGLVVVEGILRRNQEAALPAAAASAPAFEPALSNVTLPAFAHSTLEFHGVHAPLGSYALFAR